MVSMYIRMLQSPDMNAFFCLIFFETVFQHVRQRSYRYDVKRFHVIGSVSSSVETVIESKIAWWTDINIVQLE